MSKGEGTHVAINLENDRLVAVMAHAQASRVKVNGWLRAQRPETVDGSDPAALGAWIAEELRGAGMLKVARRGKCIFAVPRGEVVLKRMTFPPGLAAAELPGMVRLQMVRQLTVSGETAAIDFNEIPSAGSGHGSNLAQPTGLTVLSGALQGDRVDWRRAVARGAGMGKLGRMALKSSGAAALLAALSQRRGGAVMGIALGCGSTEFVIVENGQLVFARATDLVQPESGSRGEEASFAEKVAVEAKRTWMSYRATPESPEIDAAMVLGDDELARLVAERCREGMELPAEAAAFPDFIEVPGDMPAADRAAVAPLVGLVAEPVIGRQTLDFLHPRKAPDLAAVRRQRMLIGSLAAVLLLGGGYTMMELDLAAKQRSLDALKQSWAAQSEDYAQYVRSKAKAEHITRWTDNHMDWPAHLRLLHEQLPDPRLSQLDELAGRSVDAVQYVKPTGKREYTEAGWNSRIQAVFTLAGRMKDRAVADTLRSRLVDDTRYRLESKGPDLPERFDWRMTTFKKSPEEREQEKTAEADAGKSGTKTAEKKGDAQ